MQREPWIAGAERSETANARDCEAARPKGGAEENAPAPDARINNCGCVADGCPAPDDRINNCGRVTDSAAEQEAAAETAGVSDGTVSDGTEAAADATEAAEVSDGTETADAAGVVENPGEKQPL
jgi:hypothetical protein